MSDAQIQILLGLVGEGQGVDSALRSMGVDVNIALHELKKHPSAKGQIKEAKQQAKVVAAMRAAQTAVQ